MRERDSPATTSAMLIAVGLVLVAAVLPVEAIDAAIVAP
ncbi:MAG: hypothetical protein ACI83Y_000260 [Candidatus Azotimanducaceae bacterium]|jgi:hypothetical protein